MNNPDVKEISAYASRCSNQNCRSSLRYHREGDVERILPSEQQYGLLCDGCRDIAFNIELQGDNAYVECYNCGSLVGFVHDKKLKQQKYYTVSCSRCSAFYNETRIFKLLTNLKLFKERFVVWLTHKKLSFPKRPKQKRLKKLLRN